MLRQWNPIGILEKWLQLLEDKKENQNSLNDDY